MTPHSMHPRYVRGCAECLERSKAGARRLTESRQRQAAARRVKCLHEWREVTTPCGEGVVGYYCTRCYAGVGP